jgi:hypothetical protein
MLEEASQRRSGRPGGRGRLRGWEVTWTVGYGFSDWDVGGSPERGDPPMQVVVVRRFCLVRAKTLPHEEARDQTASSRSKGYKSSEQMQCTSYWVGLDC